MVEITQPELEQEQEQQQQQQQQNKNAHSIAFTVVDPSSGDPVHFSLTPSSQPPPYSEDIEGSANQHYETRPMHRTDSSQASRSSRVRRRRGLAGYFSPIMSSKHWKSALWLTVINFPFALFVWIFAFVGTVVGTTLLVTMPLGVIIWWVTLVGVRAMARVEVQGQMAFNSSSSTISFYTPVNSLGSIFFSSRVRARSNSIDEESASLLDNQHDESQDLIDNDNDNVEQNSDSANENENDDSNSHGNSFVHRSWKMFTDPYSYRTLFYFLLPKACITLPLFIISIVLMSVGLGTIVLLPLSLRILRRLAVWQRNISREVLG